MKRKKRMFRVKKQKLPRNCATFIPDSSPWQEVAPVQASLQAIHVHSTEAFCKALAIPPYRVERDTVWIAYTDASHADANGMLHDLLDPLLSACGRLCELKRTHGNRYRLSLSFGEAEPPSLVILDGALCNFLHDIEAEREPDFAIF